MGIRAAIARALARTNGRLAETPTTSRRGSSDTSLIFVHGLSGSVSSTWKRMLRVIASDPDLASLPFECYAYPSALLRLPFSKRSSGVRDLVRGLRTFVETQCQENTRVVLVGHSLGGVIASQFAIEEVKAGREARIRGIALYASPRTGVSLAGIGSRLSWRHRHLRQLSRGSDLLDALGEDWLSLKIEDKIPTIYVVGGADVLVPPDSGCPREGASNVKLMPEHGHLTLIEPIDGDDLRFKILKRFLIRDCGIIQPKATEPQIVHPIQPGDVLFDVYSRAVEPFYIVRELDRTLSIATAGANAWLSGPSGVGKTATLRRLAQLAGWHLYHVMLGSYRGLTPLELMREICSELHERMGLAFVHMPEPSLATLLPLFRRLLRFASLKGAFAVLIEEIPVATDADLANFIAGMTHLAVAAETDGLAARAIWLFSSIQHPELDQSAEHLKFRERVQLFRAVTWSEEDLIKLLNVIEANMNDPTPLDSWLRLDSWSQIVKAARGNPRFVKIFFRRVRNEGLHRERLEDSLNAVSRDLFGNGQEDTSSGDDYSGRAIR